MARSSLLGIDPAPTEPAGRDQASLGPGDSSDSGSDLAGLDGDDDDADPGLPVDVALRDDQQAPLTLGESLPASEGSTGVRDGADIGVDRVFSIGAGDGDADADADDDAFIDAVDGAPADDDEVTDLDGDSEGNREVGRERPEVDAARGHRPSRPAGRT